MPFAFPDDMVFIAIDRFDSFFKAYQHDTTSRANGIPEITETVF
jgi:hypothetical protein